MMAGHRYAYRLGRRSLQRVVPGLTKAQVQELARDLGQAMVDFDITTRRRAAMFVAQVAHESGGFVYREEIWGPTQAQRGYEGRHDLGNTYPGDGKRFRGRTYIQITGRANYREVSRALKVDFVERPQLLALPVWAAKGAAWWWDTHGCNQLADEGDFVAVTRRINGGTNGLESRKRYYRRARVVSPFLVPRRRKPS
jgi:putative chitinase